MTFSADPQEISNDNGVILLIVSHKINIKFLFKRLEKLINDRVCEFEA